ncbi:MAG: hypothetical protein ABJ370_14430 [Paracoccaceae bacterium]
MAVEDVATPEEWCKRLKKSGASVSVRVLRSMAREHGQFYSIGRAMMLDSIHIETLMRLEADGTSRRCR